MRKVAPKSLASSKIDGWGVLAFCFADVEVKVLARWRGKETVYHRHVERLQVSS